MEADLLADIATVFKRHPKGIGFADFMTVFEEEMGRPFELSKFGHLYTFADFVAKYRDNFDESTDTEGCVVLSWRNSQSPAKGESVRVGADEEDDFAPAGRSALAISPSEPSSSSFRTQPKQLNIPSDLVGPLARDLYAVAASRDPVSYVGAVKYLSSIYPEKTFSFAVVQNAVVANAQHFRAEYGGLGKMNLYVIKPAERKSGKGEKKMERVVDPSQRFTRLGFHFSKAELEQLPIDDPKRLLMVMCTQYVSPTEFWGIADEHAEELPALLSSMTNFYNDDEKEKYKLPISCVSEGICAAVPYRDYGFHRTRVNAVDFAAKTARVLFVDYGTEDVVPLDDIYHLMEEFFDALPQLALHFRIGHMTPPRGQQGWSEDMKLKVKDVFVSLFGSENPVARLCRILELKEDDDFLADESVVIEPLVPKKRGVGEEDVESLLERYMSEGLASDDRTRVPTVLPPAFRTQPKVEEKLQPKIGAVSEAEGFRADGWTNSTALGGGGGGPSNSPPAAVSADGLNEEVGMEDLVEAFKAGLQSGDMSAEAVEAGIEVLKTQKEQKLEEMKESSKVKFNSADLIRMVMELSKMDKDIAQLEDMVKSVQGAR